MPIVLINVFIFSLLRLVFWWYFTDPQDPLGDETLKQAFFVGFKFDLRLSLFVVAPVFLLGWVRRFSPFQSSWAFFIWVSYLGLAMQLILLFYVLNFGHYAYLQVPLDATALRFLDNFQTSALMVWQSYPVVWIVLGLFVVTLLYAISIAGLVYNLRDQAAPALRRFHKTMIVLASCAIVVFGMYGKLSWYPLRWSDAFSFTHPFATAVTVNPVLYSLSTLKNRDVDIDMAAVKASYVDMVGYLGVVEPDPEKLNYERLRSGKPVGENPNVVMVILESFANYKSSMSGNPLDPTPQIKQLADAGLYFDHFFTPHTGTARSVFTAMTGLADVEKVKTSTRNPLVVNQHILIDDFNAYEKFYFLGGSASWGNIRGLLASNIRGLHVYEEGSYSSPRVDVWGVSDLDLFKEANQVLRKVNGKPFFAVIQTSGNHRPYTIPQDRGSFELLQLPQEKVVRFGFHSNEELNSFRFMDYSVGNFMRLARQESYFDNTIFVFFGDHGINYNPGEHSIKAEGQLSLGSLRVPLVIYAPKLISEPRRISKPAGEVDVLPTLAAMILPSYRNTTMGRDLLAPEFDSQRYAFFSMPSRQMYIGLIDNDYHFSMMEDGTAKRLSLINSESPRENHLAQFPQTAQRMERITRGVYETTRYLRYNNPRNVNPRNDKQRIDDPNNSHSPSKKPPNK